MKPCSCQCSEVFVSLVHVLEHYVNHRSNLAPSFLADLDGVVDFNRVGDDGGVVFNSLLIQLHLLLRPSWLAVTQFFKQVAIRVTQQVVEEHCS